MRRTDLFLAVIMAGLVVINGCSKTEGTKADGTRVPTSSAQPAERPAAVGTGGAGADIKNDREFVHDVAVKNMVATELSRLALEKAAGSDIKFFAQQIIDDHTAAGNALRSIASGDTIDWPAQLDEKQSKPLEDLRKKQGTDFDREYAKAIVEGHQNLAAILESRLDVQSLAEWKTAAAGRAQSKALPDPKAEMADVKVSPLKSANEVTMKINQWAADTYPVVQKHLDSARTLETAAKKRSTN
jgi:predicted outer membrane protein